MSDPVGKRVLILVANLPVPPDRRVWHEATALTAAGYQVSVICPKGKGFLASHEVIEGVHVYRYTLPLEASGLIGFVVEYGLTLFWATVLSLRVAFTRGFDVLQACNPPDLYFLLGAFYRLFGKRFIFDHHDLCPELYEVKFNRRGFLYRVMRWLEWGTFKTAQAVMTTNESFHALARARGGVPEDRLFIVRNAPNPTRFHRVDPDPALRQGADLVLGYVGIMGNQDGVDQLLEALAELLKTEPRTRFRAVLVGDGPERDALGAQVQRLGLADVVHFTGYLGGEALLRAYSTFDIGVIPDPPNVYNDQITMNKTLEFMALGIPFALFPLAQSRRDAGEAGLVADGPTPADLAAAIRTLANDPDLRTRMLDAGLQRTREFSWDTAKTALLAAYAKASQS